MPGIIFFSLVLVGHCFAWQGTHPLSVAGNVSLILTYLLRLIIPLKMQH